MRTDLPFAPVPLWVADLAISDRALRLYVLLAGMRDYGTGQASYGRKLLSKKLRCSLDSLDRAKGELERHQAISVERGLAAGGQIARNIYTIHRIPPDSRTRAATPIAGGERLPDSRTRAATNEKKGFNENPPTSKRQPGALKTVDGEKVTDDEREKGTSILAIFNELSGKRFAGKEWLRAIIMRVREHPEMTLDEHRTVMTQQFAAPWWNGDPTPSVIYGNGKVFDRALNGVRGFSHDVGDGAYRYTAD